MKRLWELFYEFFKMGLFTFGGGLAMLPLIRSLTVEKRKWMTEEEAVDCLALCQALPGVIAINAAIYVGNKQKGLVGAVFATVGVILPSFAIIIGVVLFLGAIEDNPYVNGAFEGIKAASAGLILVAAYQVGKQVMKTKLAWFIAI
ncbi:MAG: chromate transporter, partial [Anaerovorax sp.]